MNETQQPNKDRLRLWVAALRSGEFEQGQRELRANGKYCCLGVACEVFRATENIGTWQPSGFVVSPGERSYKSFLPPDVLSWFGLFRDNPVLITRDGERHAVVLNDGYGWTFPQIADAIESTFELKETA